MPCSFHATGYLRHSIARACTQITQHISKNPFSLTYKLHQQNRFFRNDKKVKTKQNTKEVNLLGFLYLATIVVLL